MLVTKINSFKYNSSVAKIDNNYFKRRINLNTAIEMIRKNEVSQAVELVNKALQELEEKKQFRCVTNVKSRMQTSSSSGNGSVLRHNNLILDSMSQTMPKVAEIIIRLLEKNRFDEAKPLIKAFEPGGLFTLPIYIGNAIYRISSGRAKDYTLNLKAQRKKIYEGLLTLDDKTGDYRTYLLMVKKH